MPIIYNFIMLIILMAQFDQCSDNYEKSQLRASFKKYGNA